MKILKEYIQVQVKKKLLENDAHQQALRDAWVKQFYTIIKEKEPEIINQPNFWKQAKLFYNDNIAAAEAADKMMAEPEGVYSIGAPNARATRLRAFPLENKKE